MVDIVTIMFITPNYLTVAEFVVVQESCEVKNLINCWLVFGRQDVYMREIVLE